VRVLELTPFALTAFVLLVWGLQAILVVAATVELRRVRLRERHQLWRQVVDSPLAPSVSVLVPAYNEELSIAETTRSILALGYPNLEVVVVNDGSSDATLDVLIERFELHPVQPAFRRVLPTADVKGIYRCGAEPRLVVVDKENGGKADAMNAGLTIATGTLVCVIDADTLVAPDALQHLVGPFVADPATAATGGTVRLTNASEVRFGRLVRTRVPTGLLPGIQLVEYMRAFLIGRMGWNLLGGNLIVSGAFGLFRRAVVVDAGGYKKGSVGEDMELVVRMRRRGYEQGRPARVVFLPDPVAWTEAPESIRVLARQRNRWFRGLTEVLLDHRGMIGRPRYRSAGLVALPYFAVVEFLAPIVEVLGFGLLFLGLAVGAYGLEALVPVAGAYTVGVAVSLFIVLLDDVTFRSFPGVVPRLRLVTYAILEHVVYRPMTVVWRLWGLKLFVQGRSDWGHQVRRGFGT
jgi:cellulose synthase/poly-beta-1,6-N-acetylglucosamine synthase-like glycosyltransferase